MKLGWIEYFKLFPDYKIEIDDTFEKSELVCLLGYASGTYKNLQNETNIMLEGKPIDIEIIDLRNEITQRQLENPYNTWPESER